MIVFEDGEFFLILRSACVTASDEKGKGGHDLTTEYLSSHRRESGWSLPMLQVCFCRNVGKFFRHPADAMMCVCRVVGGYFEKGPDAPRSGLSYDREQKLKGLRCYDGSLKGLNHKARRMII